MWGFFIFFQKNYLQYKNDEQANEYINVECDKGAYKIIEQLTELAEEFLYE